MTPTLGRIVHALVDPTTNNHSDVAPAQITAVHGEHPDGGHLVNVRVMLDAFTTPAWLTSIRLVDDETAARAIEDPACFWPPHT